MEKFVEGIVSSKYFWVIILIVGLFVNLFPNEAKLLFKELDHDLAHLIGTFWNKYGLIAVAFVLAVWWIGKQFGDEKKGDKGK